MTQPPPQRTSNTSDTSPATPGPDTAAPVADWGTTTTTTTATTTTISTVDDLALVWAASDKVPQAALTKLHNASIHPGTLIIDIPTDVLLELFKMVSPVDVSALVLVNKFLLDLVRKNGIPEGYAHDYNKGVVHVHCAAQLDNALNPQNTITCVAVHEDIDLDAAQLGAKAKDTNKVLALGAGVTATGITGGTIRVCKGGNANTITGGTICVEEGGNANTITGGTIRVEEGGEATGISGGEVNVGEGGKANGISGGTIRVYAGGEANGISRGTLYVDAGGKATGITGGTLYVDAGGEATGITGGEVYAYPGGEVSGITGGEVFDWNPKTRDWEPRGGGCTVS